MLGSLSGSKITAVWLGMIRSSTPPQQAATAVPTAIASSTNTLNVRSGCGWTKISPAATTERQGSRIGTIVTMSDRPKATQRACGGRCSAGPAAHDGDHEFTIVRPQRFDRLEEALEIGHPAQRMSRNDARQPRWVR